MQSIQPIGMPGPATSVKNGPRSGTAVIGPEGGTVTVNDARSSIFGTTLRIPAGALDAPTVISITQGAHSCDFASTPSIRIQPNGLKFNQPATLEVRLNPSGTVPDNATQAVYQYDETTNTWAHDGTAKLEKRGDVVCCKLTRL